MRPRAQTSSNDRTFEYRWLRFDSPHLPQNEQPAARRVVLGWRWGESPYASPASCRLASGPPPRLGPTSWRPVARQRSPARVVWRAARRFDSPHLLVKKNSRPEVRRLFFFGGGGSRTPVPGREPKASTGLSGHSGCRGRGGGPTRFPSRIPAGVPPVLRIGRKASPGWLQGQRALRAAHPRPRRYRRLRGESEGAVVVGT